MKDELRPLLKQLEYVCTELKSCVDVLGVHFGYDSETRIHVSSGEFRNNLPVESIEKADKYWRISCNIGNACVFGLIEDENLLDMPIGESVEVNPKDADYFEFLRLKRIRKDDLNA